MKKILLLLALTMCANGFSNPYSVTEVFNEFQLESLCKKQDQTMKNYLEYADMERDLANRYLQKVNRDVEILKNIDVKAKIKKLISTFIATSMISNPKEQVLTVLVSTLADCANEFTGETIHNFLKIKKNICEAASHLEAANAHLKMALGLPMYVHPSVDIERYFSGCDTYLEACVMRLIVIDMHCTAFQFNIESTAFSAHVQRIRNEMLMEIEKNGRIVSKFSDDIENLMENMSEILSESPNFDANTFGECYGLLEEAFQYVSKVEKVLKIQ